MNREQAKKIIVETFENPFSKERYINFLKNFLKSYDGDKTFVYQGNYIPTAFAEYINSLERIGKYTYDDNIEIDLLIVKLKKFSSLERARTIQRNFIAWYLKGSRGGKLKDAALVAFLSPDSQDWRFSLVKMDYRFEEGLHGKIKIKEEFTPAKRWSFLVGKNEKSHTAQSKFIPIIENDEWQPKLEDLEKAFDTEIVTKEFFEKYRDLFVRIKIELEKISLADPKVKQEFQKKNVNTVDFAKKILGQIVFLYFLQKKGWFGVEKGKPWGTGPKNFIRKLFNKEFGDYQNFYNDILEPLFYEALRTDRSMHDNYYIRFNCKIPFLNGGLFDPIKNFDWVNVDILLPNEIFSNKEKTKEGDIGNGILDIFDRYNFTVNEEEPLEKEVALDPELLGKIYEKLNAIRNDNFDEYIRVLKSNKKGEETKFNKEYGVYYTPREIVHYMCRKSLLYYLETELNDKITKEDLEKFVNYAENMEFEKTAIEKEEKIKLGEQKTTKYESQIPESIKKNAKEIDDLLANIRVCDPAVGSGAFPIGMLHEIVRLRKLLSIYLDRKETTYNLKRHCIENSLYGVDIDAGAIEVCKLRFWLSMIVDEDDFHQIKPLPNLDYKVVHGDSLLGIKENLYNKEALFKLENFKIQYFNETNPSNKEELKNKIDHLIDKITEGNRNFDFKVYFSEVFHYKDGFDVVIGNPPYVSTKGVPESYKKLLEQHYQFADDLYNHFYFKGLNICRTNGILIFISSKTFWTIQTKKRLRELFLQNKIIQLFDTGNPFESAMVDTCISIIQKKTSDNRNQITFLDGSKDFANPEEYVIDQQVYATAPNIVFFKPTSYNMKIYEKLGKKVNELLNKWWDKISTSKNIEKNKKELEKYRNTLKEGDITLLGLITEGGQGLATADNGKYIGVLEDTKWADKVRKERPEKLLLATDFCIKKGIKTKKDAEKFLENLVEQEIRELFDNLKKQYGRDIFGQGWLYRIVSKDEIADVDKITEDEKLSGIVGDKTFVPYDKGDKEGNRWYAPTPYYIDWSRKNVKFLKENSGKKGEGMPVVRNTQFYFREGFCWNNVTGNKIICRIKEKSVHSTEAMTFISLLPTKVSNSYLVCLMNSKFFGIYKNIFLNVTVHLTTGDAKEFPIIIPTKDQLKQFEDIFNRAYEIQKNFEGKISEEEAEGKLQEVQEILDRLVEQMYMGE